MSKNESHEQPWMLLVLILKEIAERKGISIQQIADKSGLQRSNVSRMFHLKYAPTLKTFLAVSKAIEVNFFFEDKEGKTELNEVFESAMEQLGRRVKNLPKN